jgi:hypothetical protein
MTGRNQLIPPPAVLHASAKRAPPRPQIWKNPRIAQKDADPAKSRSKKYLSHQCRRKPSAKSFQIFIWRFWANRRPQVAAT